MVLTLDSGASRVGATCGLSPGRLIMGQPPIRWRLVKAQEKSSVSPTGTTHMHNGATNLTHDSTQALGTAGTEHVLDQLLQRPVHGSLSCHDRMLSMVR
jgi:hypothetical protein